MNINFDDFQSNVELNSVMQSKQITNKEGVEIFSAICEGKDTSRYGAKVDTVLGHIKETGAKAVNGSREAQAELNNIQKLMIEAPLLKRLNIFDFMGEKITVGYNEEVRYKQFTLEGTKSAVQATNGAFPFPTYDFTTKVMSTKNITGGVVVDHYEFAQGNCDAIQVMNEQVVTDMMNKMFADVQVTLYNSIKTATIKNFIEASGLTKASVDAVLKNARRFGKVNIMGDFSVVSQMEDMTGFKVNSTDKQFSQTVMDEIMKLGLINTYKGSSVIEIPNSFDYTKLNAAGTFYETYLPEGLLYFLTAGEKSPLKIGIKGGLRSMAGQDINKALDVVRYDLSFGCVSLLDKPGYAGGIGLVSDSTFAVDK